MLKAPVLKSVVKFLLSDKHRKLQDHLRWHKDAECRYSSMNLTPILGDQFMTLYQQLRAV